MSELLKKLKAKREEVAEDLKNSWLNAPRLSTAELTLATAKEVEDALWHDDTCLCAAIAEEEKRIKIAHAMTLISK